MTGSGGTVRLEACFKELRDRSRKALIIYVMSGDPNPAFTVRLVPKLFEAGADVVELGFPFSDPVADGPVIQAAGQRALERFSDLVSFIDMVGEIRARASGPLVCMTYYNPIFRYGESRFFEDALSAGLDGLIIPDLPVAEATEWIADCGAAGIAPIFLEAPNSEEADSEAIAQASQGFIYLVSLKGVTGSDQGMGENLESRIERMRKITDKPLAVGFGISTPQQAGDFGALCDGIVVGSGVVSRIDEASSADKAEKSVLTYITEMRAGLDARA